MTEPRILTFNFHEPYLCLMAKTGFAFDVGLYAHGGLGGKWNEAHRPKPDNLRLLDEPEWRKKLDAGHYDVIIAQNENNALNVAKAPGAKLLICHNRRTFLRTGATADEGDPVEVFDWLLRNLRHYFEFVFISESKRDDYGIPGRIILPGIDVDEYGGYTGEIPAILRVGNVMRSRNWMFDVDFQEAVCTGLQNRVVGFDPQMPHAQPAASFAELLSLYRTHRCMLHVTRECFEDGYNLAMLEAMACGMPVVSLANCTSPITNMVDGFASYRAPEIHDRLRQLLENPDLAKEIGARGREMVAKKFPMSAFVENWRNAILEAAEDKPMMHRPVRAVRRKNIYMHSVASPFTTARYFEYATRPHHNVITIGPRLPMEVLRSWGFSPQIPPYPEHHISTSPLNSSEPIAKRLPQGLRGDFYFWVDSGLSDVPEDIDELSIPKAIYLIDTHVILDMRIEFARHFDLVFLAQKAQVADFHKAGIPQAQWMPLACALELYPPKPLERIYDIAYVGSLNEEDGGRRKRLFERIAEQFPNHKIGKFWPEEMAYIYSQAKIVVNACHNNDVNMRVFEAMAGGALLITDPAIGLEDLFEDGKHLVIYRNDEDVFGLVRQYLADDAKRLEIARNGQQLVLTQHTYARRMDAILSEVQQCQADMNRRQQNEKPKQQGYYENPRREVMQYIPLRARRVLDVGCGAGVLGRTLKQERGAVEVVGIELFPEACQQASQVLDEAILGNIETLELSFADGYFDCITCADVLEHLTDPAAALRKLARVLAPEGIIIISIPNVRYYDVVSMLVSGGWTYMDAGILDATHLRFFTKAELPKLIQDGGLEASVIRPLSMQQANRLPRNPDGSVTLHKLTLHDVSDAEYEEFLVYQYVVLAGKPGADRLAEARQALDNHNNEAAYVLAADAPAVDDVKQRHIMAKALARLGKLDKAEQLYREALSLRSDPVIEGELGILLVGMNQLADARGYLEHSLDQLPDQDRVVGALGLVHLAENRLELSFDCLEKALRASYANENLLPHFLTVAQALNRLGDAEILLKDYVDFYPANFSFACTYAQLLIQQKRFDEARQRLDSVLLFDPQNAAALELLHLIT